MIFKLGRRRLLENYSRLSSILNALQSRANYASDPPSRLASFDLMDISHIPLERTRNFSIIAHVDHGKSTLADRLLEVTGAISRDASNQQVLDQLQVERERGITVKAQTVSLLHTHTDGLQYLLNLIDTPGHVDFNFEVSRSLHACQGVVLLVDANKGIQAQTVANFWLAFAAELTIVPAVNKIDLRSAEPDVVIAQMQRLFECEPNDVLRLSAKLGIGVEELLTAIIDRVPPPTGSCRDQPLRALVFDSWYDRNRGCVPLVAVIDGQLEAGDRVCLRHGESSGKTGSGHEVREVGILRPRHTPVQRLLAGQVGYFYANLRRTQDVLVGDTLFSVRTPNIEALPGFRKAVPMVYAGIYPMDQSQLDDLRRAISQLVLNDSSVHVTIESNVALGQGWRLGFLGLLHMEVFTQRLDQEYDSDVVITAPSVPYRAKLKYEKHIKQYGGEEVVIHGPADFPDPMNVSEFFEPMINGTVVAPAEYLSVVQSMLLERRGSQPLISHIDDRRIMVTSRLPLSEVIIDFFDELKAVSSGYASFDYEDAGYESAMLCRLDVLLNGVAVEELALVVHKMRARDIARAVSQRLLDTVPRQQFKVSIQVVIGKQVLARQDIKPYRKDVTAKLYGGDRSRRTKLLKLQAEGKRRLRRVANIELPRDTFIKVLKR